MRQRNPGSLGLIEGPRVERERKRASEQAQRQQEQRALRSPAAKPAASQRESAGRCRQDSPLDNDGLMKRSSTPSIHWRKTVTSRRTCAYSAVNRSRQPSNRSTTRPCFRVTESSRSLGVSSCTPAALISFLQSPGCMIRTRYGGVAEPGCAPLDGGRAHRSRTCRRSDTGVQASGLGRKVRVLRLRALCPPNQGRQGYRAPEVREP